MEGMVEKKINSDISGFYDLSVKERQERLHELFEFTPEEMEDIRNIGYFSEHESST